MLLINSLFYRLTYILTLGDKVDPFPLTFHTRSFSRCPIITILLSLRILPSLPILFIKCSAASWTYHWDFTVRNNPFFLTLSPIRTCWNRICHFYRSTHITDSSCCLSTVTPGYFLTCCDLAKSLLVAFFLKTSKTVSEEHKKHCLLMFLSFSKPRIFSSNFISQNSHSPGPEPHLCTATPEFLQLFPLYRL